MPTLTPWTRVLHCLLLLSVMASMACATTQPSGVDAKWKPPKGFQPLSNFRPSTGIGVFDVEWSDSEGLLIVLRVRYSFEPGEPRLAPGFGADEYKWQEKQGDRFKEQFRNRVRDTWSGARFVLTRPAMKSSSPVPVRVVVEEPSDPELADWEIIVRRYPDEAPDDLPASVCPPGTFHYLDGCESGDHPERGTVLFASTHTQMAFIRKVQLRSLEIWFDPGKGEGEEFWVDLPTAQLFTQQQWHQESPPPYWSARLTGYAGWREVERRNAAPGEIRPSVELAKSRLETVRSLLLRRACENVTQTCSDLADGSTFPLGQDEKGPPDECAKCRAVVLQHLRLFAHGAYGAVPHEESRLVELQVHPRRTFDTLAHEAGHMLGLGDEAAESDADLGEPLLDGRYAAAISYHLGQEITRNDGDGIMSRGGVVERHHFITFLEAIEEATGDYDWTIEAAPEEPETGTETDTGTETATVTKVPFTSPVPERQRLQREEKAATETLGLDPPRVDAPAQPTECHLVSRQTDDG